MPMIWPQTMWCFRALSSGEAIITFTWTPINTLAAMTSKVMKYKVIVGEGPVVTPRPTEPPKPTPGITPLPTKPPNTDIYLLPSPNVNNLKLGQVGIVTMPQPIHTNAAGVAYPGLVWSYKIADENVVGVADRPIIAIWPQTIWFFKGVGKGSTTITFIGNPSDPTLKMASPIIVYNITVGEGPVILPTPLPD